MKEVNFKDRVPRHPGRITLEPVAGAVNTYTMTRADDPTEAGTPLDKATFNSIVHSRLTGRYYTPTLTQASISSQTGITANPIPSSGWVMNGDTEMKSGSYSVNASSFYANSYPLSDAFDNSTSSRWQSAGELNPWLMISLPSQITLKKIKMRVDSHATSYPPVTKIQGSNNKTSWTDLLTVNGRQTAVTEYALMNTGAFQYYRLSFSFPGLENDGGGQANVYSFQFSEYDIYQYRNDFALTDVPSAWDEGQRITIKSPASIPTIGVISNRLNGVNIRVILQPNKKYELIYQSGAFDAKEV
jgi:hypothetical protein